MAWKILLGFSETKRVLSFHNYMPKTPESTQGKAVVFFKSLSAHTQTFISKRFYLNFRYLSWCFSAGDFTAHDYERKPLKYTIMNFYIFVCKPISQICPKQIMSGAEFQIGQNNQYEIYGFHIISKHVNIWQRVIWFFSLISVSFHTGFQVKAALVSNWFSKKH